MIIDFHTHIFPLEIRENRKNFFQGESAFKLLYNSSKASIVGAYDLIKTMDEEGVDKSVVFGFPWKNADTFKKHNDYIIKSVNKYPDRLIGFACFDLSPQNVALDVTVDVAVETKRCIDAGLQGVGELAFYESGIDNNALDKLEPVLSICRENRLPVLIHTNEPIGHNYPGKTPITICQIYNLAKRFPENKIVLAHWGGGIFFYTLLKKEVKKVLKNIYYDTAASPFLYDLQIYDTAYNLAGNDKILFGTDFPLLKPRRYFKELELASISEKQKNNICGLNAMKLL